MDNPLRALPKVHDLAHHADLEAHRKALGAKSFTQLTRSVVEQARQAIRSGTPPPAEAELLAQLKALARARIKSRPRAVINATGVILHTNLGRAPLPKESLESIAQLTAGYCSLEYDLVAGQRTRRGLAAETALAELVGAPDALVVNNNAAAVLLALSGLAAGREVLVSRGELIEIGGGFRIPEILARSGAKLVEVGTTNKTRLSDYQSAISEHTGCILRVHPSNFSVSGYTERPTLSELAALGKSHQVPVVKDLGGGLVYDLPKHNFPGKVPEPSAQQCLKAGVDLVCFSLDKLFGGPQGGAIVGNDDLVQKLRRDPLARALRVDKLTLAALQPVLDAHRAARDAQSTPSDDGQAPLESQACDSAALDSSKLDSLRQDHLPVLQLVNAPQEDLKRRAEAWCEALSAAPAGVRVEAANSAIGGGTLAEHPLPTYCLVVETKNPDGLSAMLRAQTPAVVARIHEGALWFDPRTVLPDQESTLLDALMQTLKRRLT